MAGMNMGVDKSGTDQLGAGIDHAIDSAIEGFSDMDDMFVFKCDDTVTKQRMSATVIGDDPLSLYERTHIPSLWLFADDLRKVLAASAAFPSAAPFGTR